MIVQDVGELRDKLRSGHHADGVGHLASSRIILPCRTRHIGRALRVVEELQHTGLVLQQIGRIDIVTGKGIVGGDEEGVVGTHGQQISIVVQVQAQRRGLLAVVHGLVHHAHVVAQRDRCRDGHQRRGCKHGVEHVGHTVVGYLHVILAVTRLIEHFERKAHGVVGLVHDMTELRGHRADERVLHQVAHQLLHILQGDGVDILGQVLLGVGLHTKLINQELATATGQEVALQSLVGRHEHGGNVLVRVLTLIAIVIVVPSRIERQHVAHRGLVGVVGQTAALRAQAHIAFLEDGVNQRQSIGLGIVVVVLRRGSIVVRSTEAVEHTAEELALAISAYHLGQVARRHQHILHLVNVSVLASHVGVDNPVPEDIGRLL